MLIMTRQNCLRATARNCYPRRPYLSSFSSSSDCKKQKDTLKKKQPEGAKAEEEGNDAVWAVGFLCIVVGVPAITLTQNYWKHAAGEETGKSTSWF